LLIYILKITADLQRINYFEIYVKIAKKAHLCLPFAQMKDEFISVQITAAPEILEFNLYIAL